MSHTHAKTSEAGAQETGGCCGGHGARAAATQAESSCCGGKAKQTIAGPNATTEELESLPVEHLVTRYRRGIEAIDRRVFLLTEKQIDMAFLPDAGVGLWPARVLIGHIADSDLAYAHRMRRAVGEDNPVVAIFDEDAFVDSGMYGNGEKVYADDPEADHARVMNALGGALAVVHTLRQWTGQWLLTLTDEQWQRRIMHPQRGPMTLKRIVAMITWHLEHHARFLVKKLDRMGIEMPEEAGGGCGSGCGCSH